MPYGQKRIFLTKLTDVSATDKEGVGTIRKEGDDEYIYLKGIATTIIGSLVTLNASYASAVLTTALGAVPRRLAIALAAIVADKYGWYQTKGTGAVRANASCGANVQLYTDTGLDAAGGGVDDLATSEHAIHGLVLTTACGGAAAACACMIDHPWTAPTFD